MAEFGSMIHFSRELFISDESINPSAWTLEAAAPGATLLMWPEVIAPRPEYQSINRAGIFCPTVS